MSAEDIRQRTQQSNKDSYEATAKYICGEQRALRSDYEFIDCPCASECWCRRWGCLGHYRIKEISFDQFLTTYVSLWIPQNARKNVTSAVLEGRPFGGRQRNAVPALHWLRQNWAPSLDSARNSGRCGLCDSAFSLDCRVANLYQAKMWSQLYYDALAPFDTASKVKIRRAGYRDTDFLAMNEDLFRDLRKFAEANNADIPTIRALDSPYAVVPDLTPTSGWQPLSRVVDKIFYSPKRQFRKSL